MRAAQNIAFFVCVCLCNTLQ